MTINEFFKIPLGVYTPVKALEKYEKDCKRDFDNLYSDGDWNKILNILENF